MLRLRPNTKARPEHPPTHISLFTPKELKAEEEEEEEEEKEEEAATHGPNT